MAEHDVLALQRAIDGYGSSSDDDEDKEESEEEKEGKTEAAAAGEATTHAAAAAAGELSGSTEEIPAQRDQSEDEDFDLAAVVAEGKRRRQENKRARLKQEKEELLSSLGIKNKPIKLPSPEAEIERMAAHVRGEAERRQQQETRRLQQRPEEITHVSAGGDFDEEQHLSRRERWRQKHAPPQKKAQQLYVGLPIGKGWHVPLVGIEGKGGYRQGPSPSASSKPPAAASPGSTRAASTAGDVAEGKKRPALTVKEKEKLKRKKGQSSHATWKPEMWMRLRQGYD